jgi:molecular chaperone DnaK
MLDDDGILNVTATDITTGNNEHIKITNSNKRTTDEINRMIQESQEYDNDDSKRVAFILKKNQLEEIMYKVKRFMNDNMSKLSENDIFSVKERIT